MPACTKRIRKFAPKKLVSQLAIVASFLLGSQFQLMPSPFTEVAKAEASALCLSVDQDAGQEITQSDESISSFSDADFADAGVPGSGDEDEPSISFSPLDEIEPHVVWGYGSYHRLSFMDISPEIRLHGISLPPLHRPPLSTPRSLVLV